MDLKRNRAGRNLGYIVMGCCVQGNEPTGSVQGGKPPEYLSDCQLV